MRHGTEVTRLQILFCGGNTSHLSDNTIPLRDQLWGCGRLGVAEERRSRGVAVSSPLDRPQLSVGNFLAHCQFKNLFDSNEEGRTLRYFLILGRMKSRIIFDGKIISPERYHLALLLSYTTISYVAQTLRKGMCSGNTPPSSLI